MNAIAIQQNAIVNAFQSRFDQYRAEGKNYAEWSGNVADLFPHLTKIWSVSSKPSLIEIGKVGDDGADKYIMLATKVGNMMIYQDGVDCEIKYFCDASYSICQSARIAGFGTTSGVVETLAQLEHVFTIADSYKA